MNVRDEEYILAIAREGNIKKAAEILNISPPGLSIFLSTLERKAGVAFFHRIGKRFVPSPAGEMYLEYAAKIMTFKQEYEAKISETRSESSGVVSVGMHPRKTCFILPQTLKKMAEACPQVKVRIFEGNSRSLYEKVVAGELDFIITNRKIANSSLEYSLLYPDRLVCVLSASHPLTASGTPVAGERLEWLDLRLLQEELFILQHPDQSTRMFTDAALAYAKLNPEKTLIVENLETASQIAAEGLGVAFNMLGFTKNFVYPKAVKYFLVGDPALQVPYYLAARKDRYLPRYAKFFAEELKAAVSKMSGAE